MTKMKFIRKEPATIIGVGSFEPKEGGREYQLPDDVAAGLIATNDPDWEAVKAPSDESEDTHPGPRRGRISAKKEE